ncbi:hypothetical protein BsWGS_09587 [Bradybaena similaris]
MDDDTGVGRNDTGVGRNDTQSVADVGVSWLSRNDFSDSTTYSFWDNTQNFSIPYLGVEDDTTDMPVMFSVRIIVIVAVISSIIILAWGTLALHRKRVRDAKKRKRRKDMLLL